MRARHRSRTRWAHGFFLSSSSKIRTYLSTDKLIMRVEKSGKTISHVLFGLCLCWVEMKEMIWTYSSILRFCLILFSLRFDVLKLWPNSSRFSQFLALLLSLSLSVVGSCIIVYSQSLRSFALIFQSNKRHYQRCRYF